MLGTGTTAVTNTGFVLTPEEEGERNTEYESHSNPAIQACDWSIRRYESDIYHPLVIAHWWKIAIETIERELKNSC